MPGVMNNITVMTIAEESPPFVETRITNYRTKGTRKKARIYLLLNNKLNGYLNTGI